MNIFGKIVRDIKKNNLIQKNTEKGSLLVKEGNSLLLQGKLDQAIETYTKALDFLPFDSNVRVCLGHALLTKGEILSAKSILIEATHRQPVSPDPHYMLGLLANQQKAPIEAIERLKKAIHIDPDFEPAYTDLCVSLFRAGKLDEALDLSNQAVKRFPGNADHHYYRGNVFAEIGDSENAKTSFEKALRINPNYAEAMANLAGCERQSGNTATALKHLEKAISLQPENAKFHSLLLLTLQYQGTLPAQTLFEKHLAFAEKFEPSLSNQRNKNQRVNCRKIRIGYVSGDFRNHSVAFFIEPTLKNHNRQNFEVFCYYTYPVCDKATFRIEKLADHWRLCSEHSDEHLAALIREDEIDILIDLSGHTAHNRLLTFARKPAPIQMTWIGYQATTGLKSMDYRISDHSMDPPGTTEKYHSETILRLSSSVCFQPALDSPDVNDLPSLTTGETILASFNHPAKITPEAISAWSEILHLIPHAKLLIGHATPAVVTLFKQRFSSLGIDAEKLIFHPPTSLEEYLKLHHRVDFCLDTFPYNGGTTTLHAAWMGVPTLTIEGDVTVARAGAATMRSFGQHDFVAQDINEYVMRAVKICSEKHMLQKTRRELRPIMNKALIETARLHTMELESHLKKLVLELSR